MLYHSVMTNTPAPTQPNAITHPGDSSPHEALQSHIAHLQVALEHELRQAPGGLSEYALIKKLQQPPWQLLGEVRFDQPELLYQVHFLLFHTLYTLRDQLAEDGEILVISALLTRLERHSKRHSESRSQRHSQRHSQSHSEISDQKLSGPELSGKTCRPGQIPCGPFIWICPSTGCPRRRSTQCLIASMPDIAVPMLITTRQRLPQQRIAWATATNVCRTVFTK